MRTFYISSIAGAGLALADVLRKANATPGDKIIFAGDINGPWPDAPEAMQILLDFPDLHIIHGPWDSVFTESMLQYKFTPMTDKFLEFYRGWATIQHTGVLIKDMPPQHLKFFVNTRKAFSLPDNIMCTYQPSSWNFDGVYIDPWIHELAQTHYGDAPQCLSKRIGTTILCSHTPTISGNPERTKHFLNTNTGAMYPDGRVTVAEIKPNATFEFFQSDPIKSYYK